METSKVIHADVNPVKLEKWLQSTHSERFHKLMRLWKINKMLAAASKKHVS